ncbi:hypothetical protein HGH92_25955 [Chitinophaga varians]|uniref:Uncharacterized protein n=1 Tax=Chitinophaga varians TaxID=2202339 RepID=A0A847RYA7_9BACT|nr:hypothetical protein [Chitinophaga varians]NLR67776.1 hypothetical protein [Chitinophaga varians]
MELLKVLSIVIPSLTTIFAIFYLRRSKLKILRYKEDITRANEARRATTELSTGNIDQLGDALQQYTTVVQETKDELRALIQLFDLTSKQKRNAELELLRRELKTTYASLRIHFDNAGFKDCAHFIKSDLLDIIIKLQKNGLDDPDRYQQTIDAVTIRQHELRTGINRILLRMQGSLAQSYS